MPSETGPVPKAKKQVKKPRKRHRSRVTCYQSMRKSALYRGTVAVAKALRANGLPGVAAGAESTLGEVVPGMTFSDAMAVTPSLHAVYSMGMLTLADLGVPKWVAARTTHLAEARQRVRKIAWPEERRRTRAALDVLVAAAQAEPAWVRKKSVKV